MIGTDQSWLILLNILGTYQSWLILLNIVPKQCRGLGCGHDRYLSKLADFVEHSSQAVSWVRLWS